MKGEGTEWVWVSSARCGQEDCRPRREMLVSDVASEGCHTLVGGTEVAGGWKATQACPAWEGMAASSRKRSPWVRSPESIT